jgi:integrase
MCAINSTASEVAEVLEESPMGLCKDGYWREYKRYEGRVYTGCASAKGVSEKAAQKAAFDDLNEKLVKAKQGINVLNSNTSVKSWSETWLSTYVEPTNITHKSYLNIKGKINKNVIPAVGTMKLKEVKDVHLQKILNGQAGKSLSHVTKLREYMKRMFGQAVKSRLIPFSPAEDLVLPKASDKKRRSLTPAERSAILKLAETHPAGLWVKTILFCGPRPGETIPMQWRDIDFKKQTLNIHQALESGTSDSFKAPKSDAGFRQVPIPDDLFEDFKRKRGKPLDYIFTQVKTENKGKHHTETSMRRYWLSFLRALDISLGAKVYRSQIIKSMVADDLCPYVLRHTYGTDLQNATVPINVAKYLMGHADIATTANIYTHESDEIIKLAAGLINDYASKKVSQTEIAETAEG